MVHEMSTWNYRLFHERTKDGVMLSIREAYYDCTGEHDGEKCDEDHVPHSWTDPVTLEGLISKVNEDQLHWQLEAMLKAWDKPALTLEDGKVTS
jgi:hypothetical protein